VFLDLDWSKVGGDRLGIIFHGLEGSSDSGYARGMSRAFNLRGWDAMALNFRSCSGEPNLKARFYHSGETSDPAFVIEHILSEHKYKEITLVGYSLGGNVLLKYLGEKGNKVPKEVKKAAAVSVPCELHTSCEVLSSGFNKLYTKFFLLTLHQKAQAKSHIFSAEQLKFRAKNFPEFDDAFTAPLHGFESAMDYYLKSSSKQFIPDIQTPVLVLNAQDDPFLSIGCFPETEAKNNKNVFLEMPARGGHVGFMTGKAEYYSETRIMDFLKEE